eukprot:GCRY01000208.1.p1 GENE.GCRY01000208.1~~GCRY01000208.1.p1  ORF type:complete len:106 (-),score=11.19 GCRY01000208.1:52-369(-)
MPRKAKPTKHSAGQLAQRIKESTQNAGGGKAGLADRKGGAAGHSKYQCPYCGSCAHSLTILQQHHDSKHPKIPWEPEKCTNLHELHGGTTKGVAIRGTTKPKKKE